jgi:hypothetical protein
LGEPTRISVSLRRSGGLLPGQILERSVHEDELEHEEAEHLRRLVDAADTAALAARSPITGPGADMYQYELVVEEGSRRDHVVIQGSKVPEDLRPLVALLEERG